METYLGILNLHDSYLQRCPELLDSGEERSSQITESIKNPTIKISGFSFLLWIKRMKEVEMPQ